MANLINLYRPRGFADSSKIALNPATGELLKWEWESLNPEDFSLDKDGNVFHNCDDKQSWSRVVRHEQNANNFFEKEKKYSPPSGSHKKVKSPRGSKFNSSYKGRIQLRKKKYKNKKYKNSRWRRQDKKQQRRKRKREKVFKKAIYASKVSAVPEVDVCFHCLVTSEHGNIFNCPKERFCCDFCEKKFDGVRLTTKCCGFCLTLFYRSKFCEDCEKNLGEWDIDWRFKLEIPFRHHPRRCKCQNCFTFRWAHPCADCGMMSHTAQRCPWGTYDEEANHKGGHLEVVGEGLLLGWSDSDDDYEDDYEGEQIQEAVHDDYLFGWNH